MGNRTHLCETEDVSLYSGDIKVLFVVEKENGGDVYTGWWRERHLRDMTG